MKRKTDEVEFAIEGFRRFSPKSPGALSDLRSRYEIHEPIGQGGMGEVYRARDRELDRWVALKLLHPSIVSSEASRVSLQMKGSENR